jgi:hypothetical protein
LPLRFGGDPRDKLFNIYFAENFTEDFEIDPIVFQCKLKMVELDIARPIGIGKCFPDAVIGFDNFLMPGAAYLGYMPMKQYLQVELPDKKRITSGPDCI